MKNKKNNYYSVKCIFVYEEGEFDSLYKYEERITLWNAKDADAAMLLAEQEAEIYAEEKNCKYIGFCDSCHLFDEPVIGKECFFILRESDLDPEEYLDEFYDTGNEIVEIYESMSKLENCFDYQKTLLKATEENNRKIEKLKKILNK